MILQAQELPSSFVALFSKNTQRQRSQENRVDAAYEPLPA